MDKNIFRLIAVSTFIASFAVAAPALAAAPNWNVTGTYTWLVLGTYSHDLVIDVQYPDGTFTGHGGYPSGSAPYTAAGQTPETITGSVSGDTITFTTTYAGPYNPGYSATVSGTIASDGSFNGASPWEWLTTSGAALPIVVSCPIGTSQSSSPVETVTIASNSSVPTQTVSSLTSGKSYIVTASGAWTNTGKNVADAEYTSVDNWTTVMNGYDISPYFLGEGEFDLLLNGAFVNWGAYNPSHTYSQLLVGTGAPASFMVFDGNSNNGPTAFDPSWYGDNVGNLTVDIYSCDATTHIPKDKDQCKDGGWKNLTDDQGNKFKNQGDCVSFVATHGKNKGDGEDQNEHESVGHNDRDKNENGHNSLSQNDSNSNKNHNKNDD